MATPVSLRSTAERDIASIVDFYRDAAGEAVASDLVDALAEAFSVIGRHPGAGSTRYADELRLPGLRSWTLARFPYSVFYVVNPREVDVWRVLHDARDLPAELAR